jgi:putative hydrolase of the HAD superfamily
MTRFSHIIFDLDNTLYPASTGLLAAIGERMAAFVQQRLGVDAAAARALCDTFYESHGLTVCGLRAVHGVDPQEYFSFVHGVDYTQFLVPAPELDAQLQALPQHKSIFTNADAAHAAAVLERLGIARHFDQIFDVSWSEFQPKPHPASYRRVLETLGCAPQHAVLIEDTPRNLVPARELGMTTIWIGAGEVPPYADTAAETIAAALRLIAEWGYSERLKAEG